MKHFYCTDETDCNWDVTGSVSNVINKIILLLGV